MIQKTHVSISKRLPKDPSCWRSIYVDDLLIIGDDLAEINTIKADLSKQFDIHG
jgi:hypothetical protein